MSNQIKRNKQIMPKHCHMLNKFAINCENAIIIPVVRDWYLRMSGQFFRFPCTCIRPKMLNAQAILGFVGAIVAFLPVTNVYLFVFKSGWIDRQHTVGTKRMPIFKNKSRTCASIRAFVSLINCSRTCINWNRASRVCNACCSNWSRNCWISDPVDTGAFCSDLSSLFSYNKHTNR